MAQQLEALEDELVDAHDKALHGLGGVTLGDVGALSWNVARGDTPLPILTLDWEAMLANVRLMQGYCDANGCLLAPHGKTTMAPQVWAEQLRAGRVGNHGGQCPATRGCCLVRGAEGSGRQRGRRES